jgi:hypothetical protein
MSNSEVKSEDNHEVSPCFSPAPEPPQLPAHIPDLIIVGSQFDTVNKACKALTQWTVACGQSYHVKK